ncbi:MAG: hypothetical protein NC123_10075 [Butyrivibrio sp.]|nr:hypothetical protein [Acetatifactor muris]MCM1559880.1 hypothetical protein [Butyrivibrio sp.]
MWTDVIAIFQRYMGAGFVVLWFMAALIYLFVNEKEKPKRIVLVYMPIIMLALYFNPLFASAFCKIVGSEIYFRVCWLMPVIVVIAYAAVCIFRRLTGKKQLLFAAAVMALIALSGKPVYSNPLYSRAENSYHVPDSVVHICDAIVVPGREVMAAFPSELLLYVRQYSPMVCMPYGREVIMGYSNLFYETMEQETVALEELVPLAREKQCHYIILGEEKEILGNPREFGWELFGQTDGYIIYRDTAVPLVLPETDG